MKKIESEKLDIISGGLNCWVTGVLTVAAETGIGCALGMWTNW